MQLPTSMQHVALSAGFLATKLLWQFLNQGKRVNLNFYYYAVFVSSLFKYSYVCLQIPLLFAFYSGDLISFHSSHIRLAVAKIVNGVTCVTKRNSKFNTLSFVRVYL